MSALDWADAVAAEAGVSRGELDDLAALRHSQYAQALSGGRAFQRRYMVHARIPRSGQPPVVIETDEGIRPAAIDEMAMLAPSAERGLHTCATQARPADGTAGALVTTARHARELARGAGVIQIIAIAFARVAPGRMPEAAVSAAQGALDGAGLAFRQVDAVTTHSPFAVGDICPSTADRDPAGEDECPRLPPCFRASTGPDWAALRGRADRGAASARRRYLFVHRLRRGRHRRRCRSPRG